MGVGARHQSSGRETSPSATAASTPIPGPPVIEGEGRRLRTAVLISGRGSNMEALVAAARDPAYPAEIVLVLSNRADAGGLAAARAAGIAAEAVEARPFGRDREAHERALHARLQAHGVELVALAGYMRVLTPWLVSRWEGRMLNIHPSLLPHFPGLDTHARALAAGHANAGCSVHLVTEDLDAGPVLGQAETPILPGETPDSLAARVLELEHRLYPQQLALHAERLRSGP